MADDFPRQTDILKPWVNDEYFTELSRERGTETHEICGRVARGIWVPKHELYQGYIDSFKDWFKSMVARVFYVDGWAWDPLKKEWVGIGPLHSKVYGFRGSPDFIGRFRNMVNNSIADWKTSVTKQVVWELQVSGAYRILAEENGYGPIDTCWSVRLDKDGKTAKGEPYGDLRDVKYFLEALDLWRKFNG